MKHMIKKTMLTGALSCFLLGTALADNATNQPAKPYWQDIQVVAVNKEAPRSSFMSYGDRATALSSRYEKSPFYSLLNGTWKFYFIQRPSCQHHRSFCQHFRLGRHYRSGKLGGTGTRYCHLHESRI